MVTTEDKTEGKQRGEFGVEAQELATQKSQGRAKQQHEQTESVEQHGAFRDLQAVQVRAKTYKNSGGNERLIWRDRQGQAEFLQCKSTIFALNEHEPKKSRLNSMGVGCRVQSKVLVGNSLNAQPIQNQPLDNVLDDIV